MSRCSTFLLSTLLLSLTFFQVHYCIPLARELVLDAHNASADVFTGERLNLRCNARIPKMSSVKWYKDDEELREMTDDNRVKVQKQWLIFKSIRPRDIGAYACVIWNKKKHIITDSRNITLKMNDEKENTRAQSTENLQDVLEGYQADTDIPKRDRLEILSQRGLPDTVSLTESADDDSYDNDDQTLDLKAKNYYNREKESNEGQPDATANTKTTDSRDTEQDNNNGVAGSFDASAAKTLPHFKNQEKMHRLQAKPAGSYIKLKCPAEGNPAPNITWFKNDQSPPERQLGDISMVRWSLTLEDLITQDSGNYTCKVCNEMGCIDFTFLLEVIERYPSKPYIKEGFPGNKTALVNSTVSFHCPPTSDLEPFVQWLRVYNLTYEPENDDVDPIIPTGIEIQNDFITSRC